MHVWYTEKLLSSIKKTKQPPRSQAASKKSSSLQEVSQPPRSPRRGKLKEGFAQPYSPPPGRRRQQWLAAKNQRHSCTTTATMPPRPSRAARNRAQLGNLHKTTNFSILISSLRIYREAVNDLKFDDERLVGWRKDFGGGRFAQVRLGGISRGATTTAVNAARASSAAALPP